MGKVAEVQPLGWWQGQLCQLLYDLISEEIAQGSATTDFTVDVQDLSGNWTGAGAYTKNLTPYGSDEWLHQAIYEAVYAAITNESASAVAQNALTFPVRIEDGFGNGTGAAAASAKYIIRGPNGRNMAMYAQLLYNIIYDLITNDAAFAAGDFNKDVADIYANMVGSAS